MTTNETRNDRRHGIGGTLEFFTPTDIVNKMCDTISELDWADESKTFLEPSFGNGNFIMEIIRRRISHGVSIELTLSTLYGIELMPDNVDETKLRILSYIDSLGINYDICKVKEIIERNLVCSDFFDWDLEKWEKKQVS